MRSFFLALG